MVFINGRAGRYFQNAPFRLKAALELRKQDTPDIQLPCYTPNAFSGSPLMPFPNFDYCIICEMVRPELGGKSILLGFHGLAPNVDLRVQDINRPVALSLLAGCPPVPEATVGYEYVVAITRPDGVGIFQTPSLRLVVAQDKRLQIPVWFNIAPPILPGRYSIRIMVNRDVRLDTSFSIGPLTLPEVKQHSGTGVPN